MKQSPLKKGDLIAVAAPAGPFDRKKFALGLKLLKKNFRVTHQKNIFSKLPYLAGSDERRAKEVNHFLADPKAKALLFARGGYGCQRLLPQLSKKWRAKVLVGSSDLTILLNYVWQTFKTPSLYGPMVAPHLTEAKAVSKLTKIFTTRDGLANQPLKAKKVLRSGRAEGRLIGGCLTLLTATLGTPWEVDTNNAILFLEDTNEQPYMIDRMLTQLEQAGKLKNIRGLVLGTFKLGKTFFPLDVEKVFREKFKNFKKPILWGMKFGHCPDPLCIPLGLKARIQGNQLKITENLFR